MAMAANPTIPPLHSKRVEAWVYTILNPVIQRLRTELGLLERKNLTWRAYSGRCQYILPIEQYLDPTQLPNLEDFLSDPVNPDFDHDFERHDSTLLKVEEAAQEFFRILMQAPIFQKQLESSFREFAASASGSEPMEMKDLARDVAEFLINNVRELPSHYARQPFWQDHSRNFAQLISDLEPYTSRQSFQFLQSSSERLQSISLALKDRLEVHRRYLCMTFDVPAAPIEGKKIPEYS